MHLISKVNYSISYFLFHSNTEEKDSVASACSFTFDLELKSISARSNTTTASASVAVFRRGGGSNTGALLLNTSSTSTTANTPAVDFVQATGNTAVALAAQLYVCQINDTEPLGTIYNLMGDTTWCLKQF